MTEDCDDDSDESCHDVDVAEHNGDVRIYQSDDTEIWIQSDTTVDEVIQSDADPTFTGHHPDGEDEVNDDE